MKKRSALLVAATMGLLILGAMAVPAAADGGISAQDPLTSGPAVAPLTQRLPLVRWADEEATFGPEMAESADRCDRLLRDNYLTPHEDACAERGGRMEFDLRNTPVMIGLYDVEFVCNVSIKCVFELTYPTGNFGKTK